MRKTIASFVVAASLCGAGGIARAQDPGAEVLFSVVAGFNNLYYTPAKVAVAAVGLPLGALAGVLGGGDTRAAYAIWVPLVGGRYFLTADQMDGREPVEFFGSDYADRPGRYGRAHHGSAVYDAIHIPRTDGKPCAKPCCGAAGSSEVREGDAPGCH